MLDFRNCKKQKFSPNGWAERPQRPGMTSPLKMLKDCLKSFDGRPEDWTWTVSGPCHLWCSHLSKWSKFRAHQGWSTTTTTVCQGKGMTQIEIAHW